MHRRVVITAALALAAAGARAQQPAIEWGQIHGTSHKAVPGNLPITVRALDDRPANVQIARRLVDALRRTSHQIGPAAAPLTLNFDTETERVPQRLQRGITDTRGRVKFVLTATLDETASGQRLWSGEASYLGFANEENSIFAQLAQMLVEELGKNVRVRGFALE
mgnify:CR=1 FL=1